MVIPSLPAHHVASFHDAGQVALDYRALILERPGNRGLHLFAYLYSFAYKTHQEFISGYRGGDFGCFIAFHIYSIRQRALVVKKFVKLILFDT